MNRLFAYGVLLASAFTFPICATAKGSPRNSVISHEASNPASEIVVRSIAVLDLGQLVTQSDKVWVVINTLPDIPGKFVVEQKSYIDRNNREVVIAGSDSKPLVVGRFQVSQVVTMAPQSLRGHYKWEAEQSTSPSLSRAGKDFLFVSRATLLCRLNQDEHARDYFGPIYPIPEPWQLLVKPALIFEQANTGLFDAQHVTQNELRLRQLLSDPNPFTAVAACRALEQADKLDASFVQGPLARARGLRQAVFVQFLARNVQTPKTFTQKNDRYYRNSQLAPQAKRLAQIATVASLRNLTLGVYAAGVRTAYDPFETSKRVPLPGFGPSLLRAIAQRTRELKISKPRNQDERDLLALLRNVGLR